MIKTAKISPKQIALLHVAKRELSLDEGNYRAVLSLYGGAESAKDVTQAGFTRLMNYLVRIGFKAPSFAPQPRRKRDAGALIGPWQTAKIEELYVALGIAASGIGLCVAHHIFSRQCLWGVVRGSRYSRGVL